MKGACWMRVGEVTLKAMYLCVLLPLFHLIREESITRTTLTPDHASCCLIILVVGGMIPAQRVLVVVSTLHYCCWIMMDVPLQATDAFLCTFEQGRCHLAGLVPLRYKSLSRTSQRAYWGQWSGYGRGGDRCSSLPEYSPLP